METRAGPLEFSWDDLVRRLAPSKSTRAKQQLRSVRTGAFIGVTENAQTKEKCNFVLLNTNRTGKIDWLLKQDPTFPRRLVEVFRVDAVSWDDKLQELPPSK